MGSKRIGLARMEALVENLKRELSMGNASFSGLNEKLNSFEKQLQDRNSNFEKTTAATEPVTSQLRPDLDKADDDLKQDDV